MLRISFLTSANQPIFPPSVPVVHPFYRDAFSALYHVEKSSLAEDDRVYPTENYTFLLDMLHTVLQKAPPDLQTPDYFFDTRITEEFCQTAPEYALLEGLGLRRTQPLGIRGMGSLALVYSFQLADLYLSKKDIALMCCAELDTVYDHPPKSEPCRKACGFIISRQSGDCILEKFGFIQSKQDAAELAESKEVEQVYTNSSAIAHAISDADVLITPNGFLDPLMHLIDQKKQGRAFRQLVILQYGEQFGYYQLYCQGGSV